MKKNWTTILVLSLVFGVSISSQAVDYFCWDYEVSQTGSRGSKGYSYEESGAPVPTGDSGSFNTLVYNVDGFPKCLDGNSNSMFKALLTRLDTDNYDIVLIQEMFTKNKHDFLRNEDRLTINSYPYRSKHWRGNNLTYGHGLLRLSDFPFDKNNINDNDYTLATYEYELYDDCSGTDCLTEKGFSVAVHEITPEFKIHVYNTHMDAGSQNDDVSAKTDQFDQLADFITTYSAGATVILGGDFNAKWDDNSSADEYYAIWQVFMATTGLRMACQDLIEGENDDIADCEYDYRADTDQLLYRDTDENFSLTLTNYQILDFNALSDHEPTLGDFNWARR